MPADGALSKFRSRARPRSARERACGLFLSVRGLLVLSMVGITVGTAAFSWTITWQFGVRNVESIARQLIAVSHDQMRDVVEGALGDAAQLTVSLVQNFEQNLLSKSQWRRVLARMYTSLSVEAPSLHGAAGRRRRGLRAVETSPVFQHYVTLRDASSTTFGVHRCMPDEPRCPGGYQAFFSNLTFAAAFAANAQGQPVAQLVAAPLGSDPGSLEAGTIRTAYVSGAAWSDVHLRPEISPDMYQPDRMVVSYKRRIEAQGEPAGPPLSALPPLPVQLPEAPNATAPLRAGTVVGIVGTAMHVAGLNRILAEQLPAPGSLAFLATDSGAMVASSTGDVAHVMDARSGSVVHPWDNPLAAIRAVWSQLARNATSSGDIASVDVAGRRFFASSSAVAMAPNLRWVLFLAVPRDVVLDEISRSTAVNSAVNAAWLAVAAAVAALLGWRITRPLVALRRRMVQLANTMASVNKEFRDMAAVGGPNDGGADPEPPAGEAAGEAGGARLSWAAARRSGRGLLALFACCRRGGGSSRASSRPELDPRGGGARTPEPGAWVRTPPPPPGVSGARQERQSVALKTGIRELSAFEEVLGAVRSGFTAFREMSATELALMRSLLAERKTKLEMEVRAEQTRKFIATMSHEMRTPLNGILGMLQLARESELSREAAEFVEAATVSGEHLLSIVNDVLDLQKIEAGLIELQSVPTRVADVVAAAVRILQPRARAQGLELASEVGPGVPPVVLTDPDRARQCLLNLVSNAVKYTLRGSVRVVVAVEEPPAGEADAVRRFEGREAGPQLRFAVHDTGPGIGEEAQRQLFTRFYRVRHEAGWTDPGGTGLGLAISKEIIHKMGGAIGCRSEVGRGSVFYFTVPLVPAKDGGEVASPTTAACPAAPPAAACAGVFEFALEPPGAGPPAALSAPRLAAAEAEDESASSRSEREHVLSPQRLSRTGSLASAGSAPPAAGGALRILVVEDHAMNMRVLRTMLEREGHRVTEARDGQEAVRLFEERGAGGEAPPLFDAVFMDCSMPVMDGFEATRRIRALEAARAWPRHLIVATTGHASAEDEGACIRAGMDKWLTKPIRKPLLLELVGRGGASRFPQRSASTRSPASSRSHASPAGVRLSAGPSPPAGGSPSPSPSPGPRDPPAFALPASAVPVAPAGPAPRRPISEGALGRASRPSSGLLPQRRVHPGEPAAEGGSARSAHASGAPSRGSLSAGEEGAGGPPSPRDVLVADDNEMNRRVLEALLAREGMRVQTARDGAEAVAAFEGRARAGGAAPFRAVFMDLSMPTLDGLQATRRIRELERELGAAPCPVVACTALSSSADREGAAGCGMTEYLVKPVTRAALHAVLSKCGGRPPGPAPAPSAPALLP